MEYKNSCIDTQNNCNLVRPFSNLELYSINPTTNQEYTQLERDDKMKIFENICRLNTGTKGKCCDPNDTAIEEINSSIPSNYTSVKIENHRNNEKIIKVCPEGENCPGYSPPNAYIKCKLSDATIDAAGVAHNLTPDCLNSTCPNKNIPFMISNVDKTANNFLEDRELVEAVKVDDLAGIQSLLKNDIKKTTRTLSYGFPGNTLLHEAIYRNSPKCSYYLLERTDKRLLEIKNQDGNTPLNLAVLKENKDMMNTLLKLGANIYTSNKYGDNPLHSAVRTNNLELVRYLIMNGGDINHKNRLNETPLYLAVSKPEKDIKIITILVDSGSDIFHIVKKKETDDYGEETEKEITMMKKMLDKDSSDKALEIQTYLIRKVHDYYSGNDDGYHNFINKYPEYSPYEMPKDAKKYKSPQAVDVDYNDSLDDDDLYTEKSKKPQLVLPRSAEKYIENFQADVSRVSASQNKRHLLILVLILFLLALLMNNIY